MKTFEIVYSPQEGPWGGLHVQAPPNIIPPRFTPAMNDFVLRYAELRSRPAFTTITTGAIATPSNASVSGIGSFYSRGGWWHTFTFKDGDANPFYELNNGPPQSWITIGGSAATSAGVPVSWAAFRGVLYWTDSLAHVSAWDGAAAAAITDIAFTGAVSPPIAGQTTFGSRFIGELANHLLLAYTVEQPVGGAATIYRQRIRWSNDGFEPYLSGVFGNNLGTAGATFDSTINVNAGVVDMLDAPDVITGMMMLGRVGYILRSNGITEVSPTGKGTAPFTFNHLWSSQQGIGNLYPFGTAQYGNMGVLISTEQIYKLEPYNINPIGGTARDAILTDLNTASGPVRACIVPMFSFGYIYPIYMLFINQTNTSSIIYIYSFEDNNWVKWTMPTQYVTGLPSMVYLGGNAGTGRGGSKYA